jgi:hypothetical protein
VRAAGAHEQDRKCPYYHVDKTGELTQKINRHCYNYRKNEDSAGKRALREAHAGHTTPCPWQDNLKTNAGNHFFVLTYRE